MPKGNKNGIEWSSVIVIWSTSNNTNFIVFRYKWLYINSILWRTLCGSMQIIHIINRKLKDRYLYRFTFFNIEKHVSVICFPQVKTALMTNRIMHSLSPLPPWCSPYLFPLEQSRRIISAMTAMTCTFMDTFRHCSATNDRHIFPDIDKILFAVRSRRVLLDLMGWRRENKIITLGGDLNSPIIIEKERFDISATY